MLDVACGLGQLALLAAERGVNVTGVDIATNLVLAARGRAAAAGLDVRFDEGDAEALPYPMLASLASLFVQCSRPGRARSRRLLRVCRPGGIVSMGNWTNPSFVQLPMATMPPGRQTRSSSAATRSGRGANIAPKRLATTSKLASGYGSASASPSSNRTSRPAAAARPRAARIRLVAMSHARHLQTALGGEERDLSRPTRHVEHVAPGESASGSRNWGALDAMNREK